MAVTCRTTLLLLLLLLLSTAAVADDDRPERRVADPDLQDSINRAIDQGVVYLKTVQNEDGSWTYDRVGRRMPMPDAGRREDGTGGLTALALYALAASGVAKEDEAITKGLAWVKAHPGPFTSQARYGTYSASLLVLALTRIDPRRHKRRIRQLAEVLVASQLESNLWTYRLAEASRYANQRSKTGPARDRTPGGRTRGRGDNSNSQFAVLALWAAEAIAGVEVPDETWKRVLLLYATTQLGDGAWGYHPPATGTSSGSTHGRHTMTAAGLVSYVYAWAALNGGVTALAEARSTSTARSGLRAFVRRSPAPYSNFYLVYSVERVGTVLGRPTRDWYDAGARALTRSQREDGGWPQGGRGAGQGDRRQVYETSLALLFLSRATAFAITPR